jgi:uncharacterized protein YecE (DUF72 family)
MAVARVGISGWRYAPWRGRFYPADLPQARELEYASRRFNTLEINGTFYSLQRPEYFERWRDQTPPGFVFAVKGPRYLTHMLKLSNPGPPLANFFASGILKLGPKLGPVLWQFPPQMRFNPQRLQEFLALLPHSTPAAAALAARHDRRLKGRAFLGPVHDRRIRHAVEFRHESFLDPAFIAMLRRHKVALVIADVASRFPTAEDITADFVYLRLHGSRVLYQSGYTPRELERWAARIHAWLSGGEAPDPRRVGPPARPRASGRDVYVYFDNTDVKLRAPVDAARLSRRLGLEGQIPARRARP